MNATIIITEIYLFITVIDSGLGGKLYHCSAKRESSLSYIRAKRGWPERMKNHCNHSVISVINSAIGGKKRPGSDLLSHAVTSIVPSALMGLTSLFGMGRGVSPSVLPPGNPLKL